MDVFISWSGDRSRCLAEVLRTWIPKIINAVRPWLSSADIEKGARWSTDVASKLEASKIGIICLTPGNVHSDWILFEAGALSKTLQNTYVCPLLLGLEPSDVRGPLAQFQATRATKEEIKKLLNTINTALGDKALADSHLEEAFEVWWPKLDEKLQALPADESAPKPQRPEREILEEILALVRSEARSSARMVERSARTEAQSVRLSRALLDAAREANIAANGTTVERNQDEWILTIFEADEKRVVKLPAVLAIGSRELLKDRILRRLNKQLEPESSPL